MVINLKPQNETPAQNSTARWSESIKKLCGWTELITFAMVVLVVMLTLSIRIALVEGRSMEPTLQNGNYVIISQLHYRPKRGDVVVISPNANLDTPIVKRVIAIQGQIVDIDFESGAIAVDGEPLYEPYIIEPTHLQYDISFPQTVPEGRIFVMGDNRNNSLDSRESSIGMVDQRYLLGRVLMRIAPIEKIGLIY